MAIQCCFERYEKKYCLTLSQQRFLLERMMPYMKKDEYGEYTICNIYYDTDDFRLIRASLEKPVYKEKLRVRSYGVPQADSPASRPSSSRQAMKFRTAASSFWAFRQHRTIQ